MPRLSWPLGLYRVAGESMRPTYQPGATLIGLRWFRPRPGQIVVAVRLGRPLIKRLTKLEAGYIWLEGDNPAQSTDSRQFGPLKRSDLEACIIGQL